ncbi:hypothetical protein K502DRAFT_365910 [Neoconidiobolus thromboides FSU 785]|nr:hypothetical protein K502DRAFT_365910 [Neoconidiobolus thromboides FSU 785]
MGALTTHSFIMISISATIAILNSFLIYLASKIKPRTKDINFIIAICCIEYLLPVVGWANTINAWITKKKATDTVLGCQILGFVTMSIFFFEVMVNALLAIERYSHITKQNLLLFFSIPALIASVVFIVLISISAAQNLFVKAASDSLCMVIPNNSLLTAITFYFFILCMFLGLLTIFYCYLKLAIYTNNVTKFIEIDGSSSHSVRAITKKPWSIKWVKIRIYTTLIAYGVCTFTSLLCGLAESIHAYVFGIGGDVQFILNLLTVILYLLGALTNSMLLLFLHAGISRQSKIFFKNILRDRK